ncbi:hypothetical protein Ahy_A06g027389 [Arachis hypogaea]|uniref:60S ribosomal protein L38 n=1 Tax=Arachis hypogaea TaxID=3818 RepID=A0A445CNH8_ARAHY|nr:hypothetical protein Ahy_A06g027389 [Arachis hypogaea]
MGLCPRHLQGDFAPPPKSILQQIKDFPFTTHRKDAHYMKIKWNRDVLKFKVRCSKHLYTLCVFNLEKAHKLKQSLSLVKVTY